MKGLSIKIFSVGVLLAMTACNSNSVSTEMPMSQIGPETTPNTTPQAADLQKNALVSFKLTDAPNKALQSVMVDIDHLEVLMAGEAKAGRLIVAKGLGVVDLLKLRDGVTLPLQDVVVPQGLKIEQIRLVLKLSGHFAVKPDGSLCELKTPSAQKTGIKVILTNKFRFEAGYSYNIVVDFDALESVVIQGNGRCLLKPVLKLKSATKTLMHNGSENDPRKEDRDGANPDDSEIVSKGPGEVLLPTPEVNDSTDDGWDSGSQGTDSYPELTPEELAGLL